MIITKLILSRIKFEDFLYLYSIKMNTCIHTTNLYFSKNTE